MANAFTNDDDAAPDYAYAGPLHSYAAPSLAEGTRSGYLSSNQGYASPPTADPQRSQRLPGHDFRPDPDGPPEDFYRRNGADVMARHSVEDQDADGFTVRSGVKRFAPDPRSVPTEEPRQTQRMSPRTYTFLRPFDVGAARQFNGMHMSMAAHRRNFPVLGMGPVRSARNTFRITPTPWDTDIVDVPPSSEPTVIPGRIVAVDIPPSTNRSGRLD